MIDERFNTLAKNLVGYSMEVQKGENVLIEIGPEMADLATSLVNSVYDAGGNPFVNMNESSVLRSILMRANKNQIETLTQRDEAMMSKMDCYVSFRGNRNEFEMSDVPPENMELYQKIYSERVHSKLRVDKTKWVVLRYPSPSMAQMGMMSTAAFEDFYFNVCNLDYSKMSKAMDSLVKMMDATDTVEIKGKDTDLRFSIKGLISVKCDGKRNIPDGEVYTAPVLDSVEGYITYNTPSRYQGVNYENIRLEFRKGVIVDAKSKESERLNKVFETDEGARRIGEFAIGVNPNITKPVGDILFDEKIAGSIHFTPGNCYTETDNGNKSAIHWDLVYLQTPEYGGGEIYFDGKLIRKDGLFVVNELECLNPDNLK